MFTFSAVAAAMSLTALGGAVISPTLAEMTVEVGGAPAYPSKNIIENAGNLKDHTTPVAAVNAADLVETLQGEGPFTVFAPANRAFDKLLKGTVETLLNPENKTALTTMLTYHVIPGKISAADFVAAVKKGGGRAMYKTIEGEELTVRQNGPRLEIIDAKGGKSYVTIADADQENSVIHVVETVLLPKLRTKRPANCDIFVLNTVLAASGLADDGVGGAGVAYGPGTANPDDREARDGRAMSISDPKAFDNLDARITIARGRTAPRSPRTRAAAKATTSFTVPVDSQCVLRIDSFARMVRILRVRPAGDLGEYTVEAEIRQAQTVIATVSATYDFVRTGAGIAIRRNTTPLPPPIPNPSRFPVTGERRDRAAPFPFTLTAGPVYTLEFTLDVSGVAWQPPLRPFSSVDVNARLIILPVF